MEADGEDWNGLEMTILKSLAIFFKIHEPWRSSFKWLNYYVFKGKVHEMLGSSQANQLQATHKHYPHSVSLHPSCR